MKGTWLRILLLLVFVGALAVGGGWWMIRGQTGSSPPVTKNDPNTAPLESENKADPAPVRSMDVLTLPSTIEPFEAMPVSTKLTASIAKLYIREGMQVQKDQLICTLDATQVRQQIDAARLAYMQTQEALRNARQTRALEAERKKLQLAQAQRALDDYRAESALETEKAQTIVNRAKRDLDDQQALYAAKAVSAEAVRNSEEALDDAQRALTTQQTAVKSRLASLEKALEQVKLDNTKESVTEANINAQELSVKNAGVELAKCQRLLTDTQVRAPIAGTVHVIPRARSTMAMASGPSSEKLGPGVQIYEGDPFLEIATTEQGCCRVEVDETDVGCLRIGMPAKITGDAFAGRELQGEIVTIETSGRKAGEGVSLFPVTIRITSPLQGMRMGMTADVTINLKDK
jgi:multidrug efflux pump subunit AcrA (membrane-fusion protein)